MSESTQRYWSDLTVGEFLPERDLAPIDRVDIVRFAGATEDFNPRHVDESAAREQGLPGVTAHPTIGLAWMGRMVTDWAGNKARVQRLGGRFVKLIQPGEALTLHGRVVELHHQDGVYEVELDLWGENLPGELVIRGSARVQLFYDASDEDRQARGEPPFVYRGKDPPALEERLGATLHAPKAPRRRGKTRPVGGQKKESPRKVRKRAATKQVAKKKAAKRNARKKAAGKLTKKATKKTAKKAAKKKTAKKAAKKVPRKAAKKTAKKTTRKAGNKKTARKK